MAYYRIAASASPDAILLNPGDEITVTFTPSDEAIVNADRVVRS